jgi:hypothetical protein
VISQLAITKVNKNMGNFKKIHETFTAIQSGRKTITGTGTPETLVAVSTEYREVLITPLPTNTGAVYVGGSGTLSATPTGVRLGTPASAVLPITIKGDDLMDITLAVDVAGNGVCYTYIK